MNIFLTIIIFYLGTALGSFLSVLIHRYKENKGGIFLGRSMCPHCKTKLQALDLVPLASYLLLKGKCRHCEKKISPHYFYIELLTGIIFAFLYIQFPFYNFLEVAPYSQFDLQYLISFLDLAIISCFLIVIFFYDFLYQEIPDIFSLPPIAIGIIHSLLIGNPNITDMMIGGAAGGVFFEIQVLISRGRWIGGGDVRLGILMGVILGWKLLIVALFGAYLIGAAVSIYLLLKKRATGKTAIAFGPFLVTGTFIALFAGDYILSWYTDLIFL